MLESIASKLAPTVSAWARSFVGAGLPAMVVNDDAGELDERGVLESIASRLVPAGVCSTQDSFGPATGFAVDCFCARHVAGGIPNWLINHRVNELAIEYPSMSAIRLSE
ncbi:hypothetical protein D3C75_1039500 [compost metagenome]